MYNSSPHPPPPPLLSSLSVYVLSFPSVKKRKCSWFSSNFSHIACLPSQNDISDVLDLTFSIDADEEKLILYERTEVRIFPD